MVRIDHRHDRLRANNSSANLFAMHGAKWFHDHGDDGDSPPGRMPPFGLDGVDPLSYRVLTAFTAMFHANRKLMGRAFNREGAHPAQGGCLMVLSQRDGMSQREIADQLRLAPPTITAMLQRMEKGGIVVRRPDAEDQRLVRVYLTDEGRALESELRGAIASHINHIIGAMSEQDRSEFARLLELMAQNINQEIAATDAAESAAAGEAGPAAGASASPPSDGPPQRGRRGAEPARTARADRSSG
jgi:MarR family transcriptional regulator, organic hydroperoxide resistance regulator